jgi:hypothetical protein
VILGMLTLRFQKNGGWREWALCRSTMFLLGFSIGVAIVTPLSTLLTQVVGFGTSTDSDGNADEVIVDVAENEQ